MENTFEKDFVSSSIHGLIGSMISADLHLGAEQLVTWLFVYSGFG